jgi:hypothetical protein
VNYRRETKWRKAGQNKFMVLAMLHCGNNAPQRWLAVQLRWDDMQQKPPDGGLFRRERLAPRMQLRFNLKKMA